VKTKLILVNLLSLSRFPTAALIFYCVRNDFWVMALMLIIWGFASDIADGYIAKKHGVTTKWGNLIDLTSDISLDIAIIGSLAMKDVIPWSGATFVIAVLTLMRIHGLLGKPPGSPWEKVATVSVLIYSPSMLLIFVPFYILKAFGIQGVLISAVVGIVAAAVLYRLEKGRVDGWIRGFFN